MEQYNERAVEPSGSPDGPAPDTFLDPTRTTFWAADGGISEHVVQNIELPDEEPEAEHSKPLAFLNAILFLAVLAAFLFCFFETGFLQYLLHY